MDKVLQGIGSIGFILVVIAAIAIWVWLKQAQGQADNTEGVTATLKIPDGVNLRITATELIEGYGGTRHRLAGLVARVEEGGTVNRRFTVTRIVALGVLAAGLPKKIDDRTLYLTIEGPNTIIVSEIPMKKDPKVGSKARAFAAKINQLSRAAASGAQVTGPTQATATSQATANGSSVQASSPMPNGSIAEKLRELYELRAGGLISDEEYKSKKAELIARY